MKNDGGNSDSFPPFSFCLLNFAFPILLSRPPEFHPQEIGGAMGENPPERAPLDADFAKAAHARTPPTLRAVREFTTNEKNVALGARERRRLQLRDAHGKFQLRLADESDFAVLLVHDLMHVAFGDRGFGV